MPVELYLLGAAVVLGLIHILWAVNVKTAQYGIEWNTGARDAEMPPLKPLAGRLARAQANFFETFPLFAAVLLAAVAAERLGWKTELGAHLYVWGRLVYLPLYAAGIPKIRTLVWLTSLAGLVLVLWALLVG